MPPKEYNIEACSECGTKYNRAEQHYFAPLCPSCKAEEDAESVLPVCPYCTDRVPADGRTTVTVGGRGVPTERVVAHEECARANEDTKPF